MSDAPDAGPKKSIGLVLRKFTEPKTITAYELAPDA